MVKFKIWLVKLNLNIVSFLPVLSRYKIAKHPNCPIPILEKLANDEEWRVCYWVARHPNCPISALEKLANDEDSNVRYCVAMHPNCPISSLEKLAIDESWMVRSWVARHPNCPQYLKEYFKVKNFISSYENSN